MANRRDRDYGDRDRNSRDEPPYTRLFILGARGADENVFKEAFGKYGEITDLRPVRDRSTNEPRGITYITFKKTSEAVLAMEEMNGKTIPGYPKPLKVVMASRKEEGNQRDESDREREKLLRLFIMIPKDFTEEQVKERFKEYGEISYVQILREKSSGESRGLAFVKFYRGYHAALAYENCDSSYKAVYANPKENKDQSSRPSQREWQDDLYESRYDPYSAPRSYRMSAPQDRWSREPERTSFHSPPRRDLSEPIDRIQSFPNNGITKLEIVGSPGISQEQMYALFNVVPGLDSIQFNLQSGVGCASYKTPQCAAWAKDKLNGFEYPPGSRLMVQFSTQSRATEAPDAGIRELGSAIKAAAMSLQVGGDIQSSIQMLAKAMRKAEDPTPSELGLENLPFCSVPLPPRQSLAPESSPTQERLFIVAQPDAPPERYIRDVFSRFGDLIEVFFLARKNYGYARFASKEAAEHAIKTLHGQFVCDMRLKVMVADPNQGKKRRWGNDDEVEEEKKARIH